MFGVFLTGCRPVPQWSSSFRIQLNGLRKILQRWIQKSHMSHVPFCSLVWECTQQCVLDFALALKGFCYLHELLSTCTLLKNYFSVLPSLLRTLIFNACRLVMSKCLPKKKLLCSWRKQNLKLFYSTYSHHFIPHTSLRTLEVFITQRNFCWGRAWKFH